MRMLRCRDWRGSAEYRVGWRRRMRCLEVED
jgi:hypothetical protein